MALRSARSVVTRAARQTVQRAAPAAHRVASQRNFSAVQQVGPRPHPPPSELQCSLHSAAFSSDPRTGQPTHARAAAIPSR